MPLQSRNDRKTAGRILLTPARSFRDDLLLRSRQFSTLLGRSRADVPPMCPAPVDASGECLPKRFPDWALQLQAVEMNGISEGGRPRPI